MTDNPTMGGDGLVERLRASAQSQARDDGYPLEQHAAWEAADRIEALEGERREVNISLDTLPFWPWLWADPAMERGAEQIIAAEKRLRVNYETAREPIPNQYALVHRWDMVTLMHAFWRQRARSGLLDDKIAALTASEALVTGLRNQLEGAAAFVREIADCDLAHEDLNYLAVNTLYAQGSTAKQVRRDGARAIRTLQAILKDARFLAGSTLDRLEGDQEIGSSNASRAATGPVARIAPEAEPSGRLVSHSFDEVACAKKRCTWPECDCPARSG